MVDLTGSGVILQKIPARKSEVPYVTNLNEFNGDFTYTPSERADELNRKEIHNQDSFHCIKMCFILEGWKCYATEIGMSDQTPIVVLYLTI